MPQPRAPEQPTPPAPPVAEAPAPSARTSLQYGLNVFVWGQPDTRTRDLATARNAGFEWQKSLFQWRAVERSPGQFDWSEADRVVQASNAAGLNILARLDFQPAWARQDGREGNGAPDDPATFARFVSALVSRYAPGSPNGELQAIQVWNEPNLQREWGSPITRQSAGEYVALLSAAYAAAKEANPAVTVVTAGLSPTGWNDDTARPDDQYLQWLFDSGLSGNYDVLGLHGNAQAPDPTAAPGSLPGFSEPSFYFRRVEQLRAIQEKNGDGDRPVWLLEFGWTSDQVHDAYSWYAVSEEQKAQNILAAYRYALDNWQPWIGPMMLWVLPDPNWGPDREEYWWGVANPDGSARPALSQFSGARGSGTLP